MIQNVGLKNFQMLLMTDKHGWNLSWKAEQAQPDDDDVGPFAQENTLDTSNLSGHLIKCWGARGEEGNLCGWVSHPGECKCLLAFSSYRTKVNSSRMADKCWLDLFIQPGKILGCHVNRAQEDLFRLEFDKEVRNMRPTVSPSLCRYSTVTLFQDYSQGTLKLLLSSIIFFHPYHSRNHWSDQ